VSVPVPEGSDWITHLHQQFGAEGATMISAERLTGAIFIAVAYVGPCHRKA
jgi:hypothetical protein